MMQSVKPLPVSWIPNEPGFRFLGVLWDGTTLPCTVELRDDGLHYIKEVRSTELKGWYRMPETCNSCPVNEQTADGVPCGRCWYHLPDGKTCKRHGDVSIAVEYYKQTGKCMLEREMKAKRAEAK